MRAFWTVCSVVVSIWISVQPASAERRVALVIGNSTYQKVPALPNPERDAASIANLLRSINFDVVESQFNLSGSELRRAVSKFFDLAAEADVAVIFYAGHGIEVEGVNYLIPTDATLARDQDVYDEAVSLDRLLLAVEPAKKLRLIILDACRENPFSGSMKRTLVARSISRGLVRVEPNKSNTLIAFAAKAGSIADDGNNLHSPFTRALLQHLGTPGLDLRKAFGMVRDDVLTATNDRQEPFVYGSLGGADVTLVPDTGAVHTFADVNSRERADYEMAERVGTRESWESFISLYKTGYYVDLATAQRNKLRPNLELANVAPSKASISGSKPPTGRADHPAKEARPSANENRNTRSNLAALSPSSNGAAIRSSDGYASFCAHRQALCIARAGQRSWIVGMCRSEYPRCVSSGVWHGPSGKTWSAAGG